MARYRRRRRRRAVVPPGAAAVHWSDEEGHEQKCRRRAQRSGRQCNQKSDDKPYWIAVAAAAAAAAVAVRVYGEFFYSSGWTNFSFVLFPVLGTGPELKATSCGSVRPPPPLFIFPCAPRSSSPVPRARRHPRAGGGEKSAARPVRTPALGRCGTRARPGDTYRNGSSLSRPTQERDLLVNAILQCRWMVSIIIGRSPLNVMFGRDDVGIVYCFAYTATTSICLINNK